jgi:hypothetical protein
MDHKELKKTGFLGSYHFRGRDTMETTKQNQNVSTLRIRVRADRIQDGNRAKRKAVWRIP